MNNFSEWAFAKSSKLATALHRFMIEAYKRITDKKAGGTDFGTHITEGDMRVLGRKVYSLYSKENGKIEFLRRVKDEATNMESISFVATENRDGTKLWSVYKGNVSSMIKKNEQIAHLLLKRSVDLVTLLLWLVRNQIYTRGSFLYLVAGKSPVSLAEIERLLKEIQAHFRPVPIWELKNEYLIKEALIEKVMVIINYELPRSVSRVETLHICYANSWGEIFSFPMGAEEGFKKFVSILKNTGREFSFSDSTKFELFIPKGDARPRLKKEMNEFFVRMMPLLNEKANG
jgi:adenylate cyclase